VPNIALDRLNGSQKAEFVAELGDIYEHAPWVAEAVCDLRPFATLAALHEAMTAAVAKAPADQRLALIKGHPDLAGKAARAGSLTADSTAEQASAGLNQLSEQEFSDFHRLNEAYRQHYMYNDGRITKPPKEYIMSQVRVLVGTRKGAFVLTSDAKREKWNVAGPHFAGWEIFHVKGSPVNISGTMTLTPVTDGAEHRVAIDVQVKIPLVGGKIAD
jgi:OHCU decarboxylase